VIRAFIAVALEPQVIAKITEAIEQLKPQFPGVRWVRPGNVHLTLKFLGDIDEAFVPSISAALKQQFRLFPRCTINAKGLGVFPGLQRPRVLWVGLVGGRLISLALKVESALAPLGFAQETRRFTPHLTIGRWRQMDRAPQSLVQQLDQWRTYDFGISKIDSVKLMQSVLKPEGANYSELTAVPLSDDARCEGGR
jgi:RNA 2',3'-cyclic 3'-phosphodiesterase